MTNSRLTNLRIHTKPNIMKKIVLLVILAFGVINFGCDKCECDPDEYYIKYETYGTTRYVGHNLDISISMENSEITTFTTDPQGSWETVIGPVKKGFTASISVETSHTDLTLEASISVNKNDSPFALKASGESDDLSEPLEIEYTIDY
jgi:hypothetical protein